MDTPDVHPYLERAHLYSDYLGVGFDSRQESDYDLISILDAEFAVKRYEDAVKFVDRIESYLKQAGEL